MPRIRKEATVRRNEILDAAQRLIYTKGYESMTVQDILDELQISKGGFFYHFDSKLALLDALIERMQAETDPLALPIVNDAETPALEKFRRLLAVGSEWRAEHRSLLFPLMRVWYSDENVLARHKRNVARSKTVSPLLAAIFHQGIQEGVFNTPYPDQVAGAVYALMRSLNEKMVELLVSPGSELEKSPQLLSMLAAYADFIERILDAPRGSLQLADPEMVKTWLAD